MSFTYKKCAVSTITGEEYGILRKEDNAYIPFDPDNTDYQKYLLWVAEGNTAEAAD